MEKMTDVYCLGAKCIWSIKNVSIPNTNFGEIQKLGGPLALRIREHFFDSNHGLFMTSSINGEAGLIEDNSVEVIYENCGQVDFEEI